MRRVKVYKKMMYMYIGIIISLILILDFFFISLVFKNTLNNDLYINESLGKEINNELIGMDDYSNTVINSMYLDHNLMNDVSDFLKMDTITYLRNKLDKYSNGNKTYFNGVEKFTKNAFLMNDSIKSISFISYSRSEVSIFNNKNQIKVEKISSISEENKFVQSNVIIGNNKISFVRNITNPESLKLEGKIVITYDLAKIMQLVKKHNNYYEVILLDSKGNSFFDSEEERGFEPYEYYKKIKEGEANEKFELDKDYYVYKATNKLDVTVISKFLESKTKILPRSFVYSIIFIDILVFIVAMKAYIKRLKKLNERTEKILIAMEKVKSGDLDTRIEIEKNVKDDLASISENFNVMCEDLKEHIEERYTAEIKRKKAELSALQSQINPHFLYNTLEGIRMKAICNGDRDVAKMLYSLAFLFRNQIKEKEKIMIKNEIDYCTKYIEIFKFRYEDVFSYKINCEKDIENKEIIKFALQPLIENYFVHGIVLDRKDNYLEINIFKNDEEINIEIKDNGKGIEEERLEEVNNYLEEGQGVGTSIGLSNANERIKIAYGTNYGIKIKKGRESGVVIKVNIPCKEVDNDEKCNVSR
ncbi:MAG: sensor histidine kinase [Clostridium sp.]|uniref:sensor histidine kinase n=1 Tax=Clostridium sp. TaxID=1506 RepID=UPI003EE6E91B